MLNAHDHDEAACDPFRSQFLVDDLDRSIAYYQKIGFSFGEPWEGFYAIGHLDADRGVRRTTGTPPCG